MNIDNDQYEYDELRWLARDTQKNRRRGIWWTAGLVFGAMTLAAIYVSREPPQTPVSPIETGTTRVVLENPTVTLEATGIEDPLTRIAGALERIDRKLPTAVNLRVYSDPAVEALSDLVWLVEGSRRFPMTDDDILWIRDADIWVRAINLEQREVRIWGPDRNPEPTGRDQVEQLPLGDGASFQLSDDRGNSNCATLEWLGVSRREGFTGGDYYDIDVALRPQDPDDCRTIP